MKYTQEEIQMVADHFEVSSCEVIEHNLMDTLGGKCLILNFRFKDFVDEFIESLKFQKLGVWLKKQLLGRKEN